jgi:hypothetical protein
MRIAFSLSRCIVCCLSLAISFPTPSPAETPSASTKLTQQQRERLAEANRLAEESKQLSESGKTDEAIGAAERDLAIKREIPGNDDLDVAASLQRLAALRETKEDFPAARQARRFSLSPSIRVQTRFLRHLHVDQRPLFSSNNPRPTDHSIGFLDQDGFYGKTG